MKPNQETQSPAVPADIPQPAPTLAPDVVSETSSTLAIIHPGSLKQRTRLVEGQPRMAGR